ncbi:MAG: NAD(P)-dependent oxidoreductase, partial [Bdellovibrionota bacterium]
MFKEVSELKDKRILVVGLGKTGVSLSHFLCAHGAQVTVTDHKSKPELSAQLELLGDLPIKYELGSHSPKTFLQQDLVILSPGVPGTLKIFDYARSQGIAVTGEFEFAQHFIKEPMVAITGTNAKTTVARLAEAFLKASDIKCWVGGANERPITDYLRYNEKAQVVIAEVSSFMLEHCGEYSPSNIVFT